MKEKRIRRGTWVCALGVVLMLLGAAALFLAGDTLQYAFPAPQVSAVRNADGEQPQDVLTPLYEAGMEHLASIADTLDAYAIAARRQGVSLFAGVGKSAEATLYAVGEGYFDVMHETLREGRFISGTDVARAEDVIVIGEKTALLLFPGVEPVGQTLTIDGIGYEVAGVIAGGRRLGESEEAVCYIPITAAGENAMQMQTVTCVSRAAQATGTAVLMEDTLRAWQPGGSFYNMAKLRLGAAMPLRWALLFAGVSALLAALGRLNAWVLGVLRDYRQQLRTRYLRQMAVQVTGHVLLGLLLYGLWGALVSALAVFSIQPLLVFTEWVPEVVVELSSLESRFWSLNDANAAAIRCITREAAVMELGDGLVRWGFMALLLGLWLRGVKWINER